MHHDKPAPTRALYALVLTKLLPAVFGFIRA